jgi:hypothetical protein
MANRELTDMARYAPPYTFAVPVVVSSADQIFDGNKICALQSTTAGVVKIDTPESTGVSVSLPAGVPMQIFVTKVYSTGTAGGLQSGAVTALGFLS